MLIFDSGFQLIQLSRAFCGYVIGPSAGGSRFYYIVYAGVTFRKYFANIVPKDDTFNKIEV